MYIIHELKRLQNVREGIVHTGSLKSAKAKATRGQILCDTVLKITDMEGRPVAIKDVLTQRWYNPN